MPDRPNVATGHGTTKPKKKSSKPKSASPKGTYDWGDGKGKVHSIPKAQHQRNVAAKQNYGLGPDTPLDAPLTGQQAWGMANAQAGQIYDPQIQQARQMQTNAPVWYQNYIDSVKASQAASAAYSQPIVDTAKTAVTNAGATAPGLDPSSPQYAKEQEAAKGRQAITQLGASTLEAIPAALNAYMAGQQAIAARELPQVLAGYGQQVGQLQGQRGQAVNSAYGEIRSGEQNASLARQTLSADVSNAAADNELNAAKAVQDARDKKAGRVVSRKNTRDRITAQGQAREVAESKAAEKERQKQAAAKQKKSEQINKATGKVKSRVRDAQSAWDRYARMKNPATDAQGNVVPGKFVKPSEDQVASQLKKDGYSETEIRVMRKLRAGQKLSPADVEALHDLDPNFRVPREWMPSKTPRKPRARPTPPKGAPKGYGPNDSFGGT